MLIHNELDSISDVFPFSNSGFLLVDRHDGRNIVGFSLPMLCAFLLFNTFLIPVFELVLDQVEGDRKDHKLALLG